MHLTRVGPLADPVLLQLVREAYEHFESPESRVDIRDWVKTARPFVVGQADDVIDPRD